MASLLKLIVNDNQKQHFNSNPAQTVAVTKSRPKKKKVESKPDTGKLERALDMKSKLSSAKIQCIECTKSFSRVSNLNQHVQSIHEKKSRFNCNFCDFRTRLLQDFLRHISTHFEQAKRETKNKSSDTEDKAVCLLCQVCLEDFESAELLARHYMQKHQVVRKFECDYCDYRSFRKSTLVKHITCQHLVKSLNEKYNEEHPFKCTFKDCQKRFKTMKVLKAHIKITHSGRTLVCLVQSNNRKTF